MFSLEILWGEQSWHQKTEKEKVARFSLRDIYVYMYIYIFLGPGGIQPVSGSRMGEGRRRGPRAAWVQEGGGEHKGHSKSQLGWCNFTHVTNWHFSSSESTGLWHTWHWVSCGGRAASGVGEGGDMCTRDSG